MKRKTLAAAALAGALTLTACSTSTTGGDGEGGDDGVLTVGTTDKITKLDPAGAYDNGSFFVMTQVFPFLMEYEPGTADARPGIAESADYTSDTAYEVKLKEGLTFSNGNELTSSDVKFSFERQKEIADPNGPASLLGSVDSIDTPDDTTVVFNLNRPTDQTFPQVLAGPAGPIVDEDVFAADELTDDSEIVDADAFAGPFRIDSYDFNNLVSYQAFEGYQGSLEPAAMETVNMTYYSDANNMKLDVEQNTIDVAWRSLSATDIEDLEGGDSVDVHKGPGGEIRYIVFNMDTMPYGAETDEADEEKSLAVRQAVAGSLDRQALADQVYKGTYTPLESFVPEGLDGANTAVADRYLDDGGPDVEAAEQALEEAGVETPVDLSLQYNPDHYGPSSGDEYALVKQQLEDTGLFSVDLQSTEWVQYAEDRTADVYPSYQLGWFPDYSDADNYLVPFFYDTDDSASFLGNHFRDEDLNEKLEEQVSVEDPAERAALIEEIQDDLAEQLPTVPLLQGEQIAVTGTDVQGTDDTLDPSFQFRLALLSK